MHLVIASIALVIASGSMAVSLWALTVSRGRRAAHRARGRFGDSASRDALLAARRTARARRAPGH